MTLQKFTLKILWLTNSVAIAIDQTVGQSYTPLTPYFFWPRNDAWEHLKSELQSKPWIPEEDKTILLEQASEIINCWQNEDKNQGLKNAQEKFPLFIFSGSYLQYDNSQ